MTNKPITRTDAIFAMTPSHPDCQQTPAQIARRRIKLQCSIDVMNLEFSDDYPEWSMVELGGYYGVLTKLDTGAYNIDMTCTNNKFSGFECEELRHAEKLYVDAMDKAAGFDRGAEGYQPATHTGDGDKWVECEDGNDVAHVNIPQIFTIMVSHDSDASAWKAQYGDTDEYTVYCDCASDAVAACKDLLIKAINEGRP